MATILIALAQIAINGLVSVASVALAVRHLSIDQTASWIVISAAYTYVSLFDLGASSIVQRNVASGRPDLLDDAGRLAKTLFAGGVAAGGLIFGAGVLLHAPVLVPAIGAMLMRTAANVLSPALVSGGEVVLDRAGKMVSAVVLIATQYVLLKAHVGLATLPISILFATVAQTVTVLGFSGRLRALVTRAAPDLTVFWKYRSDHVNWLYYTVPALFIYNYQVFALRTYSNAETVALFGSVHQVFYYAISVFSVISTLSAVRISALHFGNNPAERNRAILGNLRTILSCTTLALLVVTVAIVEIWTVFFPAIQLGTSHHAVALYGAFLIVEAAQMAVTNALISAGYTNFKWQSLASALLNVGGCYVLIPKFGFLGAIASVVLAQSGTCHLFNLKAAVATFGLTWREILQQIAVAVGAYVIVVHAAQVLRATVPHGGVAALVLVGCGTIYWGSQHLFRDVVEIIQRYRATSGYSGGAARIAPS
ncbi:MAG: hypothetical protein HZA93_20430 [Verrucomicrobia bacterium]|nr:hypothetical protein [Verrucomicrobiota bacterium]